MLSEAECAGEGNRLIGLVALAEFVNLMKCPGCDSHSLVVNEGVGTRRGLITKMMVLCEGGVCESGEECTWTHTVTDPYSSEAKGLNCKSVFGSRLIGRVGVELRSCQLCWTCRLLSQIIPIQTTTSTSVQFWVGMWRLSHWML